MSRTETQTEPKPKFVASQAMKNAAMLVFKAMAIKATVEPIVTAYKLRVLRDGNWSMAPRYYEAMAKRDKNWSEVAARRMVQKPGNEYMLSDEDAQVCFQRYEVERVRSNLPVNKDGACPLLEAECTLMECKRAFAEVMSTQFNLTVESLLSKGIEPFDKFVELSLRLIAPFIDKAEYR